MQGIISLICLLYGSQKKSSYITHPLFGNTVYTGQHPGSVCRWEMGLALVKFPSGVILLQWDSNRSLRYCQHETRGTLCSTLHLCGDLKHEPASCLGEREALALSEDDGSHAEAVIRHQEEARCSHGYLQHP